jgi:Fe2+ transport system protein B
LGRYVRTISTDKHLGVGFEQVTLQEELDLSDFVNLEILVLNGQLINKLKIDRCSELKFLVINSTDLLSELDISKNSKLIAFDCTDNKNLGSPIGQLSEKKDEEIKELRRMLDKSKEETINYKIQSKEGKLEIFVREIGVDRMQIRKLRNAYQNLIKSSEVNRNNIFNDEEVEVIKDDLLEEKKISLENVQKLCSKCEKLAELRIEREKLHQRNFEARQEELNLNLSNLLR